MGRLDSAGALWLKTDKNGAKYMSGVFERSKLPAYGEQIRIIIFKNQKMKDSHPDYRIFLDEAQPKPSAKAEPQVPNDDDDIPF